MIYSYIRYKSIKSSTSSIKSFITSSIFATLNANIIVCTTMYTDDESIHFSRLKGYGINMNLYGEYVCIATIVVAYIYIYSHAVPIEFDNPDV